MAWRVRWGGDANSEFRLSIHGFQEYESTSFVTSLLNTSSWQRSNHKYYSNYYEARAPPLRLTMKYCIPDIIAEDRRLLGREFATNCDVSKSSVFLITTKES
jgi:hypothetical protein